MTTKTVSKKAQPVVISGAAGEVAEAVANASSAAVSRVRLYVKNVRGKDAAKFAKEVRTEAKRISSAPATVDTYMATMLVTVTFLDAIGVRNLKDMDTVLNGRARKGTSAKDAQALATLVRGMANRAKRMPTSKDSALALAKTVTAKGADKALADLMATGKRPGAITAATDPKESAEVPAESLKDDGSINGLLDRVEAVKVAGLTPKQRERFLSVLNAKVAELLA